MAEAVIVSSVRTPVGRGFKGSLRTSRPDDLAALVIREALARVPQLNAKQIDDVILGCAMPEGEQGMNVARIAALRAGLPVETSAMTVNRFCASGLQSIALAAERIRGGGAQVIVAGGTESMSMVPMGGNKVSPNPWLVDHYPDTYINMGLGTENIARKFGIGREQADRFAVESHRKAVASLAANKFSDETVPVEVKITSLPNGNGAKGKPAPKPATEVFVFDRDEMPRPDTSMEVLAGLKPAFHAKGTVTAGNSSPMSDGAAGGDVGGESHGDGTRTSSEICLLRNRRMPSGRIRHWTGICDSEGAGPGRAFIERYGGCGAERSVCRTIAGRDSTSEFGRGSRQSERRRDRARTSPRVHGSEAHRFAHPRTRATQGALRHGDDVHRRRHGSRGDFRAAVTIIPERPLAEAGHLERINAGEPF